MKDTGGGPYLKRMKKMCPFKGFTECLQKECMAWADSDCRMFAMPMFAGLANVHVSATQPVVSYAQTETPPEVTSTENGTQEQNKNLAKVYVSEVSLTKNGNTRAECRVENGREDQIIIAKNGVGKVLQEGQGKKFEIEYNVMKDGVAWFAIKANQIQ